MRQLHPARWSGWVLLLVCACALVMAFSTGLWVQALVRNMPGEPSLTSGHVVGIIRGSPSIRYCRYLIDVKLDSGSQVGICAEFGFMDRKIPPALADLRPGDPVVVSLSSTTFGTRAVIVK